MRRTSAGGIKAPHFGHTASSDARTFSRLIFRELGMTQGHSSALRGRALQIGETVVRGNWEALVLSTPPHFYDFGTTLRKRRIILSFPRKEKTTMATPPSIPPEVYAVFCGAIEQATAKNS
jgi:predicted DNA binding protein